MTKDEVIALTISESMELADNPGVEKFTLIGSSTVEGCEPKDVDFLVLLADDPENLDTVFERADDVLPGDLSMEEYKDWDEDWCSMRRGKANYIVTTCPDLYAKSLLANDVVRLLKLTDKRDRVAVHRLIRDGHSVEQARAGGDAITR